MTEELRRTRVEKLNIDEIQLVMYNSIDEEWVKRFIDQYSFLKWACVQKIEWLWVKEIYHKDIIEWFDALNELIQKYNIKRKNIYNMNETENSIEIL